MTFTTLCPLCVTFGGVLTGASFLLGDADADADHDPDLAPVVAAASSGACCCPAQASQRAQDSGAVGLDPYLSGAAKSAQIEGPLRAGG